LLIEGVIFRCAFANCIQENEMLKHVFAATALAALVASPALAQSPSSSSQSSTPPTSASPAPGSGSGAASANKDAFLQDQASSDWRASKLIGTNVYGPDNGKIGDVSDVLLDSNGSVHAVIIGVGGFLGVGQKDVAVPFSAMTVTRSSDGDKIEKITVKYTKADLQSAPSFKYREASAAGTAPSGSGSGGAAPERSSSNTPAR
jgi:sporulation protein YlmC with PRC-barrel domain